jgi:hypothetical protein
MVKPWTNNVNKTTPNIVATIPSRLGILLGKLKAKAMDTAPLIPPHQITVCSDKLILESINQLLKDPKL